MGLVKLNDCTWKNANRSILIILYNTQLQMNQRPDLLNKRPDTLNLIEEKVGNSLLSVNIQKKKKKNYQPTLVLALVGHMAYAGYFRLNQQSVSTQHAKLPTLLCCCWRLSEPSSNLAFHRASKVGRPHARSVQRLPIAPYRRLLTFPASVPCGYGHNSQWPVKIKTQ